MDIVLLHCHVVSFLLVLIYLPSILSIQVKIMDALDSTQLILNNGSVSSDTTRY